MIFHEKRSKAVFYRSIYMNAKNNITVYISQFDRRLERRTVHRTSGLGSGRVGTETRIVESSVATFWNREVFANTVPNNIVCNARVQKCVVLVRFSYKHSRTQRRTVRQYSVVWMRNSENGVRETGSFWCFVGRCARVAASLSHGTSCLQTVVNYWKRQYDRPASVGTQNMLSVFRKSDCVNVYHRVHLLYLNARDGRTRQAVDEP